MPLPLALSEKAASSLPLYLLTPALYPKWLAKQAEPTKRWLKTTGFEAKDGKTALIPGKDGSLAMALHCTTSPTIWSMGALSHKLPSTKPYNLASSHKSEEAFLLTLGWVLGSYDFDTYKSKKREKPAKLLLPKGVEKKKLCDMTEAIFLARDLINTPAGEMLPSHFAKQANDIAKEHKAKFSVTVGEDLLAKNYPTIYLVGKSSVDAPRLVDIRYGNLKSPKVTLVGKGVCFDTGGLNIKPAGSMRLMKKDMGGAAIALSLGKLIMASGLDVRLRILLPMAENAVSATAMRPMDVCKTRSGKTIEVGHTDAEGRLVLSDALTEADSETPDLLIDCATLTGAARVALGTDLPAFFTHDDKLATQLAKASDKAQDPLYRLPLYGDYRKMIDGSTADISNDTQSGYAGAITAALFLNEFVEKTKNWVHLDMMAWNNKARAGRPVGGEAQALRALYQLIEARYGN